MINDRLQDDKCSKNVQYIAYYRVSTHKQKNSGLGLSAQESTVLSYISKEGGDLIASYTEVESGKKKSRVELLKAIRHAKATKSRLVIARLDRLARNVSFTANLMESEVDFIACDMPHANKFTIHVMAALAEQEAELISNRTKAALAEARARGVTLGNPRIKELSKDTSHAAIARKVKANNRAEKYREKVNELIGDGCNTLSKLASKLNTEHWFTERGCKWTPASVSRLLRRLNIDYSSHIK